MKDQLQATAGQEYPEIFQDRQAYLVRRESLQRQGYFLADLHVHSSQSDGLHSLKDVAAHGASLGLSLAVTDHNRIPDLRGLSAGELACIIPAIEVTSREYVDILCYFYDFPALREFFQTIVEPNRLRPYMLSLSCREILAALQSRKCLVTIPHPDYPADRLRSNFMGLLAAGGLDEAALDAIHGIEVFNASRDKAACLEKVRLAGLLGKVPLVGSDAHTMSAVGDSLVYCRAASHVEFLDKLAVGEVHCIAMPTGLAGRSMPRLKMAWLHIKGLLGHR